MWGVKVFRVEKKKIKYGCLFSLILYILFGALASSGFEEETSTVFSLITGIALVLGFLCLGGLLGRGGASGSEGGSGGCGGGCGGCGGGG
ncbi:hypothetical protein OAL09_11360 [Verrucomicrobia bacterium]|nr:hypothetical protein [Verrucomicrobiota bacterium]